MSFQKLAVMGAVLMFFFTTSTVYAGLSDLHGWNDTAIYGSSSTASGIDIDGEVGHPVSVRGPSANCEPGGRWTSNTDIKSGQLPPGLSKDYSSGKISGIPTKRGHWIVEMSTSDISCNGQSYLGYTQQLRFHIKGTGRVIQ